LWYEQYPKNSFKMLYTLSGLLVLVEKASFSKEFRSEFHSGGEGKKHKHLSLRGKANEPQYGKDSVNQFRWSFWTTPLFFNSWSQITRVHDWVSLFEGTVKIPTNICSLYFLNCGCLITAANWVYFDFNISYSSCWGYSLINTLKSKKSYNKLFYLSKRQSGAARSCHWMCDGAGPCGSAAVSAPAAPLTPWLNFPSDSAGPQPGLSMIRVVDREQGKEELGLKYLGARVRVGLQGSVVFRVAECKQWQNYSRRCRLLLSQLCHWRGGWQTCRIPASASCYSAGRAHCMYGRPAEAARLFEWVGQVDLLVALVLR